MTLATNIWETSANLARRAEDAIHDIRANGSRLAAAVQEVAQHTHRMAVADARLAQDLPAVKTLAERDSALDARRAVDPAYQAARVDKLDAERRVQAARVAIDADELDVKVQLKMLDVLASLGVRRD